MRRFQAGNTKLELALPAVSLPFSDGTSIHNTDCIVTTISQWNAPLRLSEKQEIIKCIAKRSHKAHVWLGLQFVLITAIYFKGNLGGSSYSVCYSYRIFNPAGRRVLLKSFWSFNNVLGIRSNGQRCKRLYILVELVMRIQRISIQIQ